MNRVDYDTVAPAFDRRYQSEQRWTGIDEVLQHFVSGCHGAAVAEVGCGTGHWLSRIDGVVGRVFGADFSSGMLAKAHGTAPRASLVRATAEHLPWRDVSLDRVFCVNALHHFGDPELFLQECRRVLLPRGAFLTVALDPHTGEDTWWVYDYFPAALAADRRRYLATSRIRELLMREGFMDAKTTVAQRISAAVPFAAARTRGSLEHQSTSQLMVISDAEYAAGIDRLEREQPVLTADLTLYATTASLP
jgi:ubiquinone/menaquinone biosynthesis C-methylase UbiE